MFERSQSYDIHDKGSDEIQKLMKEVLEKDLSFSTETKRLGSSLLRINYFDKNNEEEQQKDNRITILQESDKRVYIQIKGKMTNEQVGQIWKGFEKKLYNSTSTSATISVPNIQKQQKKKEDVIQEIKILIEKEGYFVKFEDVQTFVENFIKEFNRIPEEKEFLSIVKGYIIMINEEYTQLKPEVSLKDETAPERLKSVLDILEEEVQSVALSTTKIIENGTGRRKCPSCGDEGSIHEMTDKSIILMAYPRIYGKKKYCGKCGFEWK
jgi:hypothetical protein